MALRAVVFDVGETLIDETAMWERAADAAGVARFTFMGVLGGLAARGKPHSRVWEIVGVDPVASSWDEHDFYEDALPCLDELRSYVGDRFDNDVVPALAAGMVAVHIRRGPWGHLHEPPSEALRIRSLSELPEALAHV